jgi:hypothetical protein
VSGEDSDDSDGDVSAAADQSLVSEPVERGEKRKLSESFVDGEDEEEQGPLPVSSCQQAKSRPQTKEKEEKEKKKNKRTSAS